MAQDIQYITNEAGERVGVVLDFDTYQRLTSRDDDPELLTDLNLGELLALAESSLSAKSQSQLDDLLIRNAEGQLSEGELEQLDQSLSRIDHLNILKARSSYNFEPFRHIRCANLVSPYFSILLVTTTFYDRKQVIALTQAHRNNLEALGVKTLELFGSVARDEDSPESDIDFLVEFTIEPTLFDLFRVQHYLDGEECMCLFMGR